MQRCKATWANAFYMAALANSYAAEVATEVGDKGAAKAAAEAGIEAAKKAVAAAPDNASITAF